MWGLDPIGVVKEKNEELRTLNGNAGSGKGTGSSIVGLALLMHRAQEEQQKRRGFTVLYFN